MKKIISLLLVLCILALTAMTFPVSAEDTDRIVSVYCDNVVIYEHCNGYFDSENVFYYYHSEAPVTVTLASGEVFTCDWWDMYDRFGEWPYITDKQDESPWKIGENTATLNLCGVSYDFTVTVIENPIASISVEDIECIYHVDGHYDYYYDSEKEEYTDKWFCYEVNPGFVNVCYKDGSSEVIAPNELCEKFNCDFQANPNPDTCVEWQIGEVHTVEYQFAGFTGTYTATVVENPVLSIEIADITSKISEKGFLEDYYDEIKDEFTDRWFCYSTYPDEIKVNYRDGRSITYSTDELYEKTGYWLETENDQSYFNQWGEGTHKVEATFMGVLCEFNFIIEASPIKSLTVEDITVEEGTNGSFWRYYDENDDLYYWYRYEVSPRYIRAELKDGSVVAGEYVDVMESLDAWGTVTKVTDQSYFNQWQPGEHTAEFSLMGTACTYKVTITENNIKSISFDSIVYYENTNGYLSRDYYGENFDEYREYYRYSVYPQTVNVTYDDGSTVVLNTRKDNNYVNVEEEQSYDNQWGIGTHTVTVFFRNIIGSIDFEIKKMPVQSVSVVKNGEIPVYLEGQSFEINGALLDITYSDGSNETAEVKDTVFDGATVYSETLGTEIDVEFIRPDTNKAGNFYVELSVNGKTCKYQYKVTENKVDSIEMQTDKDGTPVVTVYKKDGSWYELRILSTDIRSGDYPEGVEIGVGLVYTDKGIFSGKIYTYDDGRMAVELFGCKSNEIKNCKWFDMFDSFERIIRLSSCLDDMYSFEFNGKVDKNNIDSLLEFMLYHCEFTKLTVDGDVVREAFRDVLGTDNVDLRMSSYYNTETDKVTFPPNGFGGDIPDLPMLIVKENGIWKTVKATYFGKSFDIAIDESGIIRHIIISSKEEPENEKGDVNGDGEVTMSDVLILRKYIAGIAVENEKAVEKYADLNGDGEVTMADTLILRKVIAGIIEL